MAAGVSTITRRAGDEAEILLTNPETITSGVLALSNGVAARCAWMLAKANPRVVTPASRINGLARPNHRRSPPSKVSASVSKSPGSDGAA